MATHSKTYKIVWLVIIAILCFPLIQSLSNIVTTKPLHGAIAKAKSAEFNWETWLSESYQENITPYLKENIGFYSDFIRINNQLNYWLTNEANAKGVVIGKSGYLYETNYIKAYLGTDFIGEEAIKNKVEAMAAFRQKLKEKGKELLVILAPGKASYFPEFIPRENVSLVYPEKTNYIAYKKALNQQQVPTIDANEWFRNMKDTSQYPLFPKCGIHWSKYGEYLIADSLSNYLNTLFPDYFPTLKLQDITWSKTNLDTDFDLGNGMNLLLPISAFPMAYPTFQYSETNTPKKKAIIVADSYYWGLHNAGVTSNFFENGEFWYYNKEIHFTTGKTKQPIDETFDINGAIANTDLVILLATDANLYKFPYGFLEQYQQGINELLKKEIAKNIKRIKASSEWLENITKKAKERGITLEEAIYNDAKYLANQRL